MKILHVIPGLGGGGGAERSLLSMMPTLTAAADIHIATFSDRTELVTPLEDAGATVRVLPARSRPAVARALTGHIRTIKPDLVHTTLVDADLVGRLAAMGTGTPVVSSLVNDRYGAGGPVAIRLKRAGIHVLDAATARGVVRFHALTEHVACAAARALLIPRHRIDVIPRGRRRAELGERTDERRAKVRAELGVDDRPLIIAAARHERQKGLDILIAAMPEVLRREPDALLLIGGRDGTETAGLRRLAAHLEASGQVRFIGPRDDVPDLMCAADVWCVPSRWEGLGSILVEAMGLGVPTVASDVPPIRETAGEPPCFHLCPPDQPGALAEAVSTVLADAALRAQLTDRARRRFEESYTAEVIGRRMLDFYRSALATTRWRRR